MERVKEKQQKELTKQKQIEKVHFLTFNAIFVVFFSCLVTLFCSFVVPAAISHSLVQINRVLWNQVNY